MSGYDDRFKYRMPRRRRHATTDRLASVCLVIIIALWACVLLGYFK